jgi:hypothetical protein
LHFFLLLPEDEPDTALFRADKGPGFEAPAAAAASSCSGVFWMKLVLGPCQSPVALKLGAEFDG